MDKDKYFKLVKGQKTCMNYQELYVLRPFGVFSIAFRFEGSNRVRKITTTQLRSALFNTPILSRIVLPNFGSKIVLKILITILKADCIKMKNFRFTLFNFHVSYNYKKCGLREIRIRTNIEKKKKLN